MPFAEHPACFEAAGLSGPESATRCANSAPIDVPTYPLLVYPWAPSFNASEDRKTRADHTWERLL